MRITKKQLEKIIREEAVLLETRPTFDLRSGDLVRHKDEPDRGTGRVVAKGSSRERMILVLWDNGTQQRHDPSALVKETMKKSNASIRTRQLQRIIREEIKAVHNKQPIKSTNKKDHQIRKIIRELYINDAKFLNEGLWDFAKGVGKATTGLLGGLLNAVLGLFGVQIKAVSLESYDDVITKADGLVAKAGLKNKEGKLIKTYKELDSDNAEHQKVLKKVAPLAVKDALEGVSGELQSMQDLPPFPKPPKDEEDKESALQYKAHQGKMEKGSAALGRLLGATKALGEKFPEFKSVHDTVSKKDPMTPADVFYQSGALAKAMQSSALFKEHFRRQRALHLKKLNPKDFLVEFAGMLEEQGASEWTSKREKTSMDIAAATADPKKRGVGKKAKKTKSKSEKKEKPDTAPKKEKPDDTAASGGSLAGIIGNIVSQTSEYLSKNPETKSFSSMGGGELPSAEAEGEVGEAAKEVMKAGEGSLEKAMWNPNQITRLAKGDEALLAGAAALMGKDDGVLLFTKLKDPSIIAKVISKLVAIKSLSADEVGQLLDTLKIEDAGAPVQVDADGAGVAAAIIKALPEELRQEIGASEDLSDEAKSALEGQTEPGEVEFEFKDVLKLEGKSIKLVLREVDGRTLTTALSGAPKEIVDHVLKNMSSRAATMIREDMEKLGEISKNQLYQAQEEVVLAFQRLFEKGVVKLPESFSRKDMLLKVPLSKNIIVERVLHRMKAHRINRNYLKRLIREEMRK